MIASGYPVNAQVRKTLKAGAIEYPDKHYPLNDLLNKIREVLDNGR